MSLDGVHISFYEMDFKCPKCECPHGEEDYYSRLDKAKRGYIYKQCKGCKTTLGISFDYKGAVVWLKEEEDRYQTKATK